MHIGGKKISRKRIIVYIAAPLLLVALALLYTRFNPEGNPLFPKCVFHALTGLECPGCGSQRAIHYILNGDIASAWRMNPLVLIFVPYIVMGYTAEILQHRYSWALTIRRKLFGVVAIWTVFATIVIFTVLRNIL